MKTLTFSQALNSGLRAAMEHDDKVVLMGEDIGKLGGVFRITDGLQKDFGAHRVIDTPLAESGIVGTAIGLAFRGYRPVVEIQFDGFVYPAFDQIVSQLAKMHFRSRGNVKLPVTIRIPFGGGIGSPEHHSESPEAYFAHTAGLRVVSPSNPEDAYWMLQQAIADDDPVIFLEPKRRYHQRGDVDLDQVPEEGSLYKAKIVRPGSDLTLIAYGPLVKTALDAATAAEDEGIDIEVIDLRSIEPVDFETLGASVRKTGRVVITHEAGKFAGIGAELAASLTERCFDHLDHAPVRVTGFDIPYPPAKLENHHLPDLDRILDGVDRAMRRTGTQLGEDG
ncbi:alpha-ketoacid dehydrogenase subunit beta [Paeniglutamicibacter kerguelensis]|uniref:Pyruvate dehydrogenase E1 component beta subunit n=1 Tax=Paeniglutamicibacter kerguelensis TaxID=254788 RepID=A0ABS4X9R1_9MICC|nr:alpha-ketoacid dehydrogenase subunit beta [Paeniglutamicibacter kerguelensis]MBP2385111.1 pyruvate dehydrogenase E1 component beta subunit [Paeniglutamicibacter kerguelensis]